jgi:dihydroorotate dehydrogenase electron transfer subunit
MSQQYTGTVTRLDTVADNVYVLSFEAAPIAPQVRPGQFLNIRTGASCDPLLRRAYSVHRVSGDHLEIIFNVVGKGSALLASRKPGDRIDLLGPLGVPFHLDGEYERAILVSGGLGIAPMPVLGEALVRRGRQVVNIHGARTGPMLIDDGRLMDARYATDDGSRGFHGTVVQALEDMLDGERAPATSRVFACGPNRMLEALGGFCQSRRLPLEVSLECQMACGIGICQGCPVEMADGPGKYTLVCTHGPNYDYDSIVLGSLPSPH